MLEFDASHDRSSIPAPNETSALSAQRIPRARDRNPPENRVGISPEGRARFTNSTHVTRF